MISDPNVSRQEAFPRNLTPVIGGYPAGSFPKLRFCFQSPPMMYVSCDRTYEIVGLEPLYPCNP